MLPRDATALGMLIWEKVPRKRKRAGGVSDQNKSHSNSGDDVHLDAVVPEAPHATRTATTYQLPQRQIIPLLLGGQDPLRLFAKLPNNDEKIAISIYNKHAEEMLKDL